MLKKFKALIENSSQGVKSSVAFALASAVSAGMSYLTTPVFTRMLTSTEYGEVTIYLTWQSIFAIIAMFSLNYGVFNNGMMDYKDDRDGYSYSLLRLSNIISICFAILVFHPACFSSKNEDIIKYLALMLLSFIITCV
jgi:O-antigen/teichoic acid export membrane protein